MINEKDTQTFVRSASAPPTTHTPNDEILRGACLAHVEWQVPFTLAGPVQLHHCRWKCTIDYRETMKGCYPFDFTFQQRRTEVVYIDMDHVHQVKVPAIHVGDEESQGP